MCFVNMANLLYPVDLTSFEKPEKDAKFREVIMTLQKQMGEPSTGILTNAQFGRLAQAARAIDDRGVMIGPGKMVYHSNDGNLVGALGTAEIGDIAYPINITRITCFKLDHSCEMSSAEFDHKNGMLVFGAPINYEITTWTKSRVTALREHPCGTASMMIDVEAEAVTIFSAAHADLAFCPKGPPNTLTLVDGYQVSRKIYRDRRNSARMLIYEPAKRFVPIER
jgi:hypothetical protein